MKSYEQTAYIKSRAALKISSLAIHEELVSIHKSKSFSYAHVAKLAKSFRKGRQGIEDEPRTGRPVTISTVLKRVRDLVAKNPYATFDEIVEQTSISRGSVFRIIHEALVLRKITSRYVPHQLTLEMRQKRVAFCRENLKRYDGGPGRLCDVITCDEVQINFRNIGRKRSNCSWIRN